ncbi:hypothetical protein TNCV_4489611, partial [Trichonephila clavipes]
FGINAVRFIELFLNIPFRLCRRKKRGNVAALHGYTNKTMILRAFGPLVLPPYLEAGRCGDKGRFVMLVIDVFLIG